MTEYSFYVFSHSDLGGSGQTGATDLGQRVAPGAERKTMTITDDDPVFDDESAFYGQTLDRSGQILGQDFEGSSAGQVAQSVFAIPISNTSTGESGTLYRIRIYEGTTVDRLGLKDGEFAYASDIELQPGDGFALGRGSIFGHVPYAELFGFELNCFVRATLIETERGEVPVEALEVGDMVRTLDSGLQPLRWVGSRRVAARGSYAPVVFAPGVLGNRRPLCLSQNHRVLLSDWRAEAVVGQRDVLTTAASLVNGRTVRLRPGGEVDYFHLLFDAHQIVFSEGASTESYHPAFEAGGQGEGDTRAEILALFPELCHDRAAYGPAARPCLQVHEAQVLASAWG